MVNVIVSTAGTSGPRGSGWLSGAGIPANSIGFDGDFYIDTANHGFYYGPKTSGVWPTPPNQFSISNSNPTAVVPPTANDDSSLGYAPLSLWADTVTNTAYICTDAAVGAAIWVPILPVGTTAGTVAAGNDPRIVGAAQISNNLSDLTNFVQARDNLSLGTAAVENVNTLAGNIQPLGVPAAGTVGEVADAGHVHQMPSLNQVGAPTADVDLNNRKITTLANGTLPTDAAAFGQIPTTLPPSGPAGGDLASTYPAPTVTATHLTAPLPIAQGGTGSATQNFVDLTTTQSIGGIKNFTGEITGPTPINGGDLVNKTYADGLSVGIVVKQSVAAATTGPLPSNTYNNGSSGVGATLTATTVGTLVVDGYTTLLNDRILVKNEAAPANNGIYVVTTVGTPSVAYVLTRATDMDQPTEIPGASVFVNFGTLLVGSGWSVVSGGPYTIGTTPINWTQFSSPGFTAAGTGLTASGTVISLTTPVSATNLPTATTSAFGIVEYDGNAGDIQPLGTASIGSTGKAADAGHVHPTTGVVLQSAAASTVASQTSYGQTPVVGVDLTYAREDHTHGTPDLTSTAPATTEAIGTAAALGVATTPARADHVHPMSAAGTPGTSAVGDIPSTGAATTFAASNHVHGREGFGTPTGTTTYGLSPTTGTATTVSHSDHTHGTPSLTATAPSTTEAIGTAAALGVATTPALADHVHPMAGAGTPTTSAVTDTPAAGNATTFAASNHVHGREGFGAVTALSAFGTPSANGTAATVSHSDHVHGAPALPSATASTLGVIQLTGDLDGTATSPSVVKVNGVSVTGTPTFGQAIRATSGSTASWSFLPNVVSTGILTGGVMTINTANSFNITQATCYIADFVSTPSTPSVTAVTVAAQTVTLGASQTTQVVNYWYADSSGIIHSQATALTPVQKRTNIMLGITWSELSTGTLFFIVSQGLIVNQPSATWSGLADALGPFSGSVTGCAVSPNGANLNINLTGGTLFGSAIGYYTTGANNPNQLTVPSETAATFKYVTQLTNSLGAARTTVDVANYDVGGVITAIPGGGGTATIHRVWLVPNGTAGSQLVLQYGQTVYSSLANATSGIGNNIAYVVCPDLDTRATFIGWIAVTKSATALNNTGQATFRSANRFTQPY